MKRFHSSLSPVLKYADLRYKQALAEVGNWMSQLAALRAQEDALTGVLRSESERSPTPHSESLRLAYQATLRDGLRRNQVQISRVGARLRESRERLNKTRIRRDSLEELEKSRVEEWRREAERDEQFELEELSQMRMHVKRKA